MKPVKLTSLLSKGKLQKYKPGQFIYSLDFAEELFLVNKGYVKRVSARGPASPSVQAVYGPGYFFPLTPMFKTVQGLKLSEDHNIYIYEAINSAEIYSIEAEQLQAALNTDPTLYVDLMYEAGRRLKSNIHRLENIALRSDYKKLAHHLVFLADEFGKPSDGGSKMLLPLSPQDLAEQLDIPVDATEEELIKLEQIGLIKQAGRYIHITDVVLLKAAYL